MDGETITVDVDGSTLVEARLIRVTERGCVVQLPDGQQITVQREQIITPRPQLASVDTAAKAPQISHDRSAGVFDPRD